jgi:hypothetical protein
MLAQTHRYNRNHSLLPKLNQDTQSINKRRPSTATNFIEKPESAPSPYTLSTLPNIQSISTHSSNNDRNTPGYISHKNIILKETTHPTKISGINSTYKAYPSIQAVPLRTDPKVEAIIKKIKREKENRRREGATITPFSFRKVLVKI